MKSPSVKVGSRIDIVFENEIMKSNAHYLKALVYDLEDKKIIISQTTPALNRRFLNRRIIVTFLVNIERRILRFGFPARILDLVTDYKIESGTEVEALVIEGGRDPEPVDFRMYFRVKPHSQSDINLFLKEERVNLVDISLGGAKFTYLKSYSFRPGDAVSFKLIIGSTVFNLEARVHEVWTPDNYGAGKNIQYVSVEFRHVNKQLEALLGKAIIEIERKLLSEGRI